MTDEGRKRYGKAVKISEKGKIPYDVKRELNKSVKNLSSAYDLYNRAVTGQREIQDQYDKHEYWKKYADERETIYDDDVWKLYLADNPKTAKEWNALMGMSDTAKSIIRQESRSAINNILGEDGANLKMKSLPEHYGYLGSEATVRDYLEDYSWKYGRDKFPYTWDNYPYRSDISR